MSTSQVLKQHLEDLSQFFHLWLDDGYRFVIVQDLKLPPGFNRDTTEVLITLPWDYPLSPPGIGPNYVHVNAGLRFCGRTLPEYREDGATRFSTPGFGPWAWICYEHIRWNPLRDNLIGFVEMLRADLTNPFHI